MIVRRLCLGLALLISASSNVWAASYSVICAVNPGTDIQKVAGVLQAKVVDEIIDDTYLLSVSYLPGNTFAPGVQYCERDTKAALPGFLGALVYVKSATTPVWYRYQPALNLVNANRAIAISRGRGIIIADIDSAVDYGHPALRGVLTGGRDFLAEKEVNNGASTLNQATSSFLDQATASFLDQATASFLDQATASFLDQATASFLDAHSPGRGHGTMVAGILAAVAPDSLVMPLRVFDDSGQANVSDIVKAIRYAVRNGARVINMSFGTADDSRTLRRAIEYAQKYKVTLVASAGNDNTDKAQYPAGYSGVITVAATDLLDRKAAFSNYGATVEVAAPGVNIISSYPGGYYAVLSGTSFSAPIVAGEAALLLSQRPANTVDQPIELSAVRLNPQYRLGYGRVDLLRALQELLK